MTEKHNIFQRNRRKLLFSLILADIMFHRMRIPRFFFAAMAVFFINRCSSPEKQSGSGSVLFTHSWADEEGPVMENGKFHSFEYLDTVSNELHGDTLLPVDLTPENLLVIRKLVPVSMQMREKNGIAEFTISRAAFRPDTFRYDIIKYMNRNFLVLYSDNSASRVLRLMDAEMEIPETNYVEQPSYRIEGYVTGDEIDRSKIDIIRSDQFGNALTEEAGLKSNPDIHFTIIGGRFIESIRQYNIPDNAIHKVIDAINSRFKSDPEYEEINLDGNKPGKKQLGYYWNENEVRIDLQKTGPTNNSPGESPSWTLEYTNFIFSDILQTFPPSD